MASENEASCESDPNFAVICGFLEKFGVTCGLGNVDFLDLQYMLENNTEVPQQLIDLHVKLLRKARKSVSTERWERALVKVCHGFGSQDAWEIERFGYRKARLPAKLRILKQLLEMQFDLNSKFKTEVNKQSAEELRTQPLGRDLLGHAYWFQADDNCQIRVYKEDPDEETWDLVAKDREELAGLITHLSDGKEVAIVNEDSNSVESEKPITDTGQIDVPITKLAENEVISTEHNIVDVSNNKEELICNGDKMSDVELENSKELDLEKSELITTNGTNDISTAIQPSEELKNTEKDSESVTPQDDKPVVSETIIEICDSNITSKEVQQDSLPVTQSVPDPDTDRFEDDAAKLDKDDILTGTPIALNQQITEATEVQNFSKSFASEVVDLKTGVNLTTVKSVSELHSVVEPSKRPETFGVKEKYMRSDISGSSSAHHRKAVDSAGYSLHTKYLKNTMNDDEEELSEPTYMKRPRLDRPTLLGYKKKKMSSESSDEDEYEDSVSDEVEEPLMLVKGEGFGHENKDENRKSEHIKLTNINDSSPIVGDVVEEPVLYFTGEGSGHECETGKDIQDKESTHADQPVQDVDNSSLSLNNSICNISNKTFKSIDVKSNKLNEVVGNVETNLEERNVHQPDVAVTESRPEGTNNLESNASILNSDLNLPEKDLHNCIGEKTLSDKNFELETGSTTTSKHTKLDKLICSDPSQVDSEDNLQLTKDSGDLVQLNDCTHSDDKEDSSNSKIQDSGSKAAVLNNAPDSDIATKIAIDVVEEAASDKNFSIYLKEKSRIKLKTSNCSTDIVNNVKQSYSKPRPKKILNYKPKIVDTLGCKKTDNIKLDIKESSLESSKLHANMITACNVEKQETPNCIELDNGILDKDVNNESIDKRITSKVQETVKKQSTGSKEDSIKSRTGGKGPDCNQNENGTEECRPTSKRATLNSSLVVENSKVSKTLENSNINPTRSSTRTRSAQNQSDKLDKTKHSGLPKMVKNKSKIEKSTSKPKHNENEADSETTAEKPEESKRELRHRTAKGITNVTVSKKTKKKDELTKKNEICNSSESNSNDGEQYCHEIEAVDKLSESPATETKIQPVEASFTQLNEHCGIEDQDDDDMEIDDTVNKIANIVEIERQIIKPSEMNLIKDVEIKTVKNLINKETISDVVQDTKVCGLVPVNEPKCVKRSLALLTCIDINKLKGSDSKDDASDTSDEVIDSSLQVINTIQEIPVKKELETEEKPIDISDSESGGKSTDVVIVGDSDPLTISEESDIVSKKSTTAPTLSSFKLDVEDSIPAARLTRKRAAEQSANNTDSSKRPKVKGKHALSHTLRHSIEKQKLKNISSSEEDVVEQKSPRIGKKKSKRRISKHSDGDTCSQGQSSDGVSDSSNKQSINKRKKPAPRKKTLLGLDISPAVENILTGDDGGIRQSRRIAQIKIKEEAERRKLEELALQEHKDEQRKRKSKKTDDKDYEVEKRKPKPVTTEDETTGDVDSEEKKKRKRKRKHGQFDASKPWKSSSGSSSSEIEEEEEEVEAEECDYRHVARSDHEFSPESDLEGDKEWMPLKRARTVRKEELDTYEHVPTGSVKILTPLINIVESDLTENIYLSTDHFENNRYLAPTHQNNAIYINNAGQKYNKDRIVVEEREQTDRYEGSKEQEDEVEQLEECNDSEDYDYQEDLQEQESNSREEVDEQENQIDENNENKDQTEEGGGPSKPKYIDTLENKDRKTNFLE